MASPEGERHGRPEPRKGVDYLVDYYAVLKVPRTADADTIKGAFRNQIAIYHEDKFRHLAKEFQDQAKFKTGILLEANDIFSDAEKKREYDERLATWDGPVSDNGYPVRVLGLRRLSSRVFFSPSADELASFDKVVNMGHTMSGHNSATFEFIRTQYEATEDPSPELVAAYREALARYDMDLALEETARRGFAGLDRTPAVMSSPAREYLEATRTDIAESRGLLETGVQRGLFMLQTGEIRAIESGIDQTLVEEVADNPDRALAVRTQLVLEEYDRDTTEIEKLAEQRQAVMEARLKLVQGEYIPDQEELFDKVAVCRQAGDQKTWYITQRNGTIVDIVEQEDDMQEALNTPEKIREMLASGHNVMYVTHQEGLPLNDEVIEAITKHYWELDLANQETT